MSGPKTALLKGFFKEALRNLKDDSAYLAYGGGGGGGVGGAGGGNGGGNGGDSALHAAAWAAWGRTQPDAHRALSRLQQRLAVAGDDMRVAWAAGKGRVRDRLRRAVAAAEVRSEELLGRQVTGFFSFGSGDGDGDRLGQSEHEKQQQEQEENGQLGAGEVRDSSSSSSSGGAVKVVDEAKLKELCGADGLGRSAVMFALAHLGRAWMTSLNTTEVVEGKEHLAAALAREQGRPLITVSNHVAAIDDPFVVAAILPPEEFSSPERLRWTLCASDRCFHRAALVPFFRAAKVLPVERGAGVSQPGLAAAEARLRAGDWVHIFPEGTRSKDGGATVGPARKGVGRLVAACAEASEGATGKPPLVVPFVHAGMADVMPRGALVPRTGRTVRVAVGPPVEVADLLAAARSEGWTEDDLHRAVAARVGLSMRSLKARLDGGTGDLDAAAIAGAAADQLEAGRLADLYDARDADANADLRLRGRLGRRWRERGAARWVASVADRLEFRAAHRDFARLGLLSGGAGGGAGGGGAGAGGGGGGWRWAIGGSSGGGHVGGVGGGGGDSAAGAVPTSQTSPPFPVWSSWAATTAAM